MGSRQGGGTSLIPVFAVLHPRLDQTVDKDMGRQLVILLLKSGRQ
jgi:hypothetical protein